MELKARAELYKDISGIPTRFIAPQSVEVHKKIWTLKPWAFSQLAAKLFIPFNYLEKCPNSLREENVNFWLKLQSKPFLLRTKPSSLTIRAVLSNKYSILDNLPLFKVARKLLKNKATLFDSYLDELRFVMKYKFNDIESVGLLFINSEVGLHSVQLYPVVYTKKANFFYIPDLKFEQRHIYTDISSILKSFKYHISKIIKEVPIILDQYENSKHVKPDIPNLLEYLSLKYRISQSEITELKHHLSSDATLQDIVNNLVLLSNRFQIERSIELQKTAGKILSKYRPEVISKDKVSRQVDLVLA